MAKKESKIVNTSMHITMVIKYLKAGSNTIRYLYFDRDKPEW